MAVRERYTAQPVIAGLPDIQISSAVADAIGQTAAAFRRLSGALEQRLDESARYEETLRGRAEGLSGQVDEATLFAPTIRGRAYTTAALNAIELRAESSISMGIEDLTAQHWNDPTALQQAGQGFLEQWLNQVPEAIRPAIALRGEVLLHHGVAVARGAQTEQAQQEAVAASLETHRRRLIDISRLSGDLFSPSVPTAQAAALGIAQIISAVHDDYSQTYTDATGAEIPLFTPQQEQQAIAAVREAIRFEGVREWFEMQPDRAEAFAQFQAGGLRRSFAITDPVSGEEVTLVFDPLNGDNEFALSPEELDRLQTWMEGEAELSLIDAIRADPSGLTVGSGAGTGGDVAYAAFAPVPVNNSTMDGVAANVIEALAIAGQRLGVPLRVTSGYRTQDEQDVLYEQDLAANDGQPSGDVAEHSRHTLGTAVDISIVGMSDAEQARLVGTLLDLGFAGIGFYGGGHIHFDMRENYATWGTPPPIVATAMEEHGFVAGREARPLAERLPGRSGGAAIAASERLSALPGFQALSPHGQARVLTAARQAEDRTRADALAALRPRLDAEMAMHRAGVEVPEPDQIRYEQMMLAYGDNAPAAWQELQNWRQVGGWVRAFGGMPAADQEALLAAAAPTGGPTFVEQQERYAALVTALRELRGNGEDAIAQRLEDAMAAYQVGETVGNPPGREELRQAHGVQAGDALYDTLESWRAAGAIRRDFSSMTPEQQAEALASLRPQDENYATEAEIYNFAAQALALDRTERADGAAYVLRHNDALRGLVESATENGDPAGIASAINSLMDAQRRIGIGEPRPMPAATATAFIDQWRATEAPSERVDFLQSFVAGLGGDDTIQAVMRQLSDAGAPDAMLIIASLDRVRQNGVAQVLAAIADTATEQLRGQLPPHQTAGDIDDATLGAMRPFMESVMLNAHAADTIALYVGQAQRLAYWYAQTDRHSDPGAAAAGDMLGYGFFGSGDYQVRVPAAFDLVLVEIGASALLRQQRPFTSLSVGTSVPGAPVTEDDLWQSIRSDGFWYALPDDRGAQLMIPTSLGVEAVLGASGDPVTVTWSRLAELGRAQGETP